MISILLLLHDIAAYTGAAELTQSCGGTILLVTLLTKPQITLLPDWDSHSNSVYGTHVAWLTN